MEEKMADVYYSPRGYFKGLSAIKKLSTAAGMSESQALIFLKKQAIWQIYLPAPRKIVRPKFENNKVGEYTKQTFFSFRLTQLGEKNLSTH